VAEAPPRALDRYFYFLDVPTQDSLFRSVVRAVLKDEPSRTEKASQLARLRDAGVFLIDLMLDPMSDRSLSEHVPSLIQRCRSLSPRRIILIKATVHDAAYWRLQEAGLPVIDERIPFPGSGQQRKFADAFRRALRKRS